VVLHVGDGVLDLQDLLGVVVGDFHVKGFFHGHDEFGEVEGVGTEVFNEEASGFTSSAVTPSCSMMIFLTCSSTDMGESSRFCSFCVAVGHNAPFLVSTLPRNGIRRFAPQTRRGD
jgi:hypothetical protein